MTSAKLALVLKTITLADIPAVLRITAVAYRKEYHESMDVFISLMNAFPEGNYILLADGCPVGYFFSHPHHRGQPQDLDSRFLALQGDEDCYYLHDMAVHPGHQRLGYTKIMFKKLLEVAADHGYSVISLVAVQKSRKFWESKGFRSVSKLTYGGLPAHLMECSLSSSPLPVPSNRSLAPASPSVSSLSSSSAPSATANDHSRHVSPRVLLA